MKRGLREHGIHATSVSIKLEVVVRLTKLLAGVLLVFAGAGQSQRPAAASSAAAPAIPHRVLKLENGLTVIMQRDPTAPDVGVEAWVRGGAREEAEGQFGFAHLFEHSISAPGPFGSNPQNIANRAKVSRNNGAGAQFDYLNFYALVAPEGLEVALAQLGDRVAGDKSKFTAERLKTDQDIVISELRRSAGGPYDPEVTGRLFRGTFGGEHPYGHSTGGLEADVLATKVEDLEAWHRRYAGAASSILFIVGNFDERIAEPLVRKHFGSLPPGPGIATPREWVPKPRAIREAMESSLPSGTVHLRWPTPGWGAADADHLMLASHILSARLGKRLEPPMTSAQATVQQWEMAGEFGLSGSFAKAQSADAVEAVLKRELASFLRNGPSAAELAGTKLQWRTDFVQRLENTVWRGGRSEVLGFGALFRGDSRFYEKQLANIASATPAQVAAAARKWLGEPGYVLHLLPKEPLKAVGEVDRRATVGLLPAVQSSYAASSKTRLKNGMTVIVAEQARLPLARVTIAFAAGSATDEAGGFGRARTLLNALPKASAGGRPLEEALADLGADVALDLDRDYASLSYTVLAEQLEPSLRLVSQALQLGPSSDAIETSKQEALERVRSAAANQIAARARAAACALKTPCDPGAIDQLGSAAGLGALTGGQARAFYETHYRPSNAILIVSGQVRQPAVSALASNLFDRGGPAPAPAKPAAPVAVTANSPVILIDRPGASQATLLAVKHVPNSALADPVRANLPVFALRSRLMDNLRTAKGWSYEVYPFGIEVEREGGLIHLNAPLQPDKTGKAIREIELEMRRLRDEDVPANLLDDTKSYVQGTLISPGLASLSALNGQLLEIERRSLPAAYYRDAPGQLAKITAADFKQSAQQLLDPATMIWVVAGDAKVLKPVLDAENIRYVLRSATE
jgi:zinc protease